MNTVTTLGSRRIRGNPTLLELSTRSWLLDLAKARGVERLSLGQVPDEEIQRFKSLGVDIVWLMGVWQIGPIALAMNRRHDWTMELPGYTTEDVIGSPYAVFEYSVNPQIGTEGDLQNFRAKLHKNGIMLMLDFVGNHTAQDCPWASKWPDMYIHTGSGIEVGNREWEDTYQLNYWNPATAKFMCDQVLSILSRCDGVRCDMAHLLLNSQISGTWSHQIASAGWRQPNSEFWISTIQIAKTTFPNATFLAEVYGCEDQLIHCGFDYVYCKHLYDLLVGDPNNYFIPHLDNIRKYFSQAGPLFLSHGANFIENHDEPRAIGDRFGHWKRANAAAAIVATTPGLRLFYDGQFKNQHRLMVQLRRSDAPLSVFYHRLLPFLDTELLHSGTWQLSAARNTHNTSAWRILCWNWTHPNPAQGFLLVAINYTGDGAADAFIPLPSGVSLSSHNHTHPTASSSSSDTTITFTEVLTQQNRTLTLSPSGGGVLVHLDLWEVLLLLHRP